MSRTASPASETRTAPDAAATIAPADFLRNALGAAADYVSLQAAVKAAKAQVVANLGFLRSNPASAGWNAGTVSGADVREVCAQIAEGRGIAVKRLPTMIDNAAE